jgi:hypothetical protein
LLSLAVLAAAAAPGLAHDGPPFPILVDEPFGDRTLSVWADPDVGVGTFYLYLPEEEEEGAGRDDPIAVWVQPSDGRLPEARHLAERADPQQPYQRIVHADFDARGHWDVRFVLETPSPAEIATDIDVTPPGAGRIDVLWFLAPFLLVAFLWAKAVLQRRSYARAVLAEGSEGSQVSKEGE